MKLTKLSSIISLITVAAASSAFTHADEFDSGWYLGGNIGQAKADIDNGRIADAILGDGFIVDSISEDDSDTGFKFFGGYQYNPHFAIEGGYFDLGKFDSSVDTIPLGGLDGSIEFQGINLDLVGSTSFTKKLSGFARVGVTYAETVNTYSESGAVGLDDGTSDERNTNPKIGLGLQYALNDNLAMRVEAERYRLNNGISGKDDVDLFSVGLVYRFGKKAQPAPEPIVAAPVYQPAPVEPPPAPKFKKYTLSATELFAFNSDEVRMPQPKLVEISDALKQSDSPKNIVIVGYSDRLGSEEYNRKLSERRAEAVKKYIASNGIDADRLKVEGRGEADPVVTCTDKNKAELIKCLGPNRRVEIDQITVKIPVKP